MKINAYDFRLNIAAQSPVPEKPQLKTVSVRIDQDLFETLESMAKVLGKSASGLAGELLETMVIRFDDELPVLRPDLTIRDRDTGFDDNPDAPICEDDDGEYRCRWRRVGSLEKPEKSEDEIIDEGVRSDVAQGLAMQEDAKKGKAKI